MQRRTFSISGVLAAVIGWPAEAQQADVFLCAEDAPGAASITQIGGVEEVECSDVVGLSSGVATVGIGRSGRLTCEQVEVLKGLDVASPTWLTLAFQRTRAQRIDLLFFAPNPQSGEIQQL